ncbi:MAG: GerMN domain-containing protein [Peptostreptococcaceae bacterium]|nr:GerMN domain-containing protein [Peptostreptococcaceae bacterium]
MFKAIFNILLILAICFTVSMIPLNTAFFNSPAINGDNPAEISTTSEYEVVIDSGGDSSSNYAQVEFTINGVFNKDFSDDFVLFDFIMNGETVKTLKASDFVLERDSSSTDGISSLDYSVNIDKESARLSSGAYSLRIYVADESAISMEEAFTDLLYMPNGTFESASSIENQSGLMNFILYYPDNQYMYLVPVTRTVPRQESVVRYLINTLSDGPKSSMGLTGGSPIPFIPYIWVSGNVSTLSLPAGDLGVYDDGSSVSLFAAEAITRTLRDNLGIEEVQVLINQQPAETALHGIDISTPWKTTGGPMAYMCLETETGKLVLAPAKLVATNYEEAIEQMFTAFKTGTANEVKSPNAFAFLPSSVELLDYKISESVITVDLSADITKLYGERTDLANMAVEALLNSLTTLMNVDKVVLTANGIPIQFEGYDFSEPMEKPAFINPER